MNMGKLFEMFTALSDSFVREITLHRCLIFIGGLAVFVFYSGFQSPSAELLSMGLGDSSSNVQVEGVVVTKTNWDEWTTRAAEWQTNSTIHDDDPNWPGRQRMRDNLVNGSLWWDEQAEQFFMSKLEESQFPTNCSNIHWIAHFEHVAGLMSVVHVFLLPFFMSMVRGHTILPIAERDRHPAFDGCGPDMHTHNLQCFFNITSCKPEEDPERMEKIDKARVHDRFRTTWDELLLEDDDFFDPAGVTIIRTNKFKAWDTSVCVGSSTFSSVAEAAHYYQLTLWEGMRRHGRAGVVKGFATNTSSRTCSGYDPRIRENRLEMAMASLMSSWLLNRMPNNVKLIADEIMSRYVDASGRPAWKPPVLAIHVRRTDKSAEDPYYQTHRRFRPIEDYALVMKQIEEEHGFQFPSIFLISDSGTAIEQLTTTINGNFHSLENSTTSNVNETTEGQNTRYIMYDWTSDHHILEKFWAHDKVPQHLKYDLQTHFLATLYILQKIADHAIVTYTSNVGRFIGEVMTAQQRLASPGFRGPVVTSLDYPWTWAI